MTAMNIDSVMAGRFHSCCATLLALLVLSCRADLPFLMVGDWGGQTDSPYYTDAQLNVAQQMGVKAEDINAQFVLSLGDHFYDFGVQDVSDIRFKETFEVRFSKHDLLYYST